MKAVARALGTDFHGMFLDGFICFVLLFSFLGLFWFVGMRALPAWMSVRHLPTTPRGQKGTTGPPELELRLVVSHHVGNGN